MIKDFRLATKIGGGFAIVLTLTATVATVAWLGMRAAENRAGNAEGVNGMVTTIMKMRQSEKDFLLDGDAESAKAVMAGMESLTGQIVSGSQELSQRTEEQASSLEETASSMEERRAPAVALPPRPRHTTPRRATTDRSGARASAPGPARAGPRPSPSPDPPRTGMPRRRGTSRSASPPARPVPRASAGRSSREARA